MQRNVLLAMMIIFLMSLPACSGANSGEPQAQQGGYSTSGTAGSSTEDLSGKVDKTIKVLTVIKDELDKMNAQEKTAPAAGASAPDQAWVDNMQGKLTAAIRMWKRADQVIRAGEAAAGTAKVSTAASTETITAELNAKIDSAIKAMEVIKKELDAVDKEINSDKK
jgi:hypothetical protein